MSTEFRKYLFILSLFLSFFLRLAGQEKDSSLVIIFAGDIMGHDSQINAAWDADSGYYNYEPTFRHIRDYITSADIAVGNLEVTLAGPPFKGYPQFSSPDELAIEAKRAGFDVMITANNHALDRGEEGFLRTLYMLDSLNFFRAGTYRDSAERASFHPLILEKNSIRIALLNYTYGTNGLKIPAPREINRIDTARIRMELLKAQTADPDFIIVCMHWGTEYERDENKVQQQLADFILGLGADAIIGSHPHVVQPVKFYGFSEDSVACKPVVYSLGNFVSNQRTQYREGGIVAELHLSKTDSITLLDSLAYLPYYVWREDEKAGKYTFRVMPVSLYEAQPDSFEMSPGEIYRLNRFAKDTREHLEEIRESGFYLESEVGSRKSEDDSHEPTVSTKGSDVQENEDSTGTATGSNN